jgi:hypothetical protein
MVLNDRANLARKTIASQLDELAAIVDQAASSEDFEQGFERLRRWKSRTAGLLRKHVHHNEGDRFERKRKMSFRIGDPMGNLADEARMYAGFLQALDQDLRDHPADILDVATVAEEMGADITVPAPPSTGSVFIVHGHDELNLLRLKELMRDRWKLDPIVLVGKPGKGRTIIEKFEEEAQSAAFALSC